MCNIENTDEIFNYGSFNVGDKNIVKTLTVFDYHEDIFKNQQKNRHFYDFGNEEFSLPTSKWFSNSNSKTVYCHPSVSH